MLSKQKQFVELHNRLYERVFSYVRLRINDSEEVKDIVQDVFLKAYKSWMEMDELPDEKTARNFLFVISKRTMIDVWRGGRHRLQGDLLNNKYDDEDSEQEFANFDLLESSEPVPEKIFEDNENRKLAVELLNLLDPFERELMNLRFLEEMEYKELAEIYKTTPDNIRQKVSRALKKLKERSTKME